MRVFVSVWVCVLQGGLRGEQVSGAKGSTEKQWAAFQHGNSPVYSAVGWFPLSLSIRNKSWLGEAPDPVSGSRRGSVSWRTRDK